MSDQPTPITDEELDALRNAFTRAPQGRTMSLIARLDLAESENMHLRQLVNHYVGITPLARIAELERSLREARIELSSRFTHRELVDAIDRVLGDHD